MHVGSILFVMQSSLLSDGLVVAGVLTNNSQVPLKITGHQKLH